MSGPLKASGIVLKPSAPPPPFRGTDESFPSVKKVERPLTVKFEKKSQSKEENQEEEDHREFPISEDVVRFDFSGEIVNKDSVIPEGFDSGLYHHGDHPDRPGYAIYELAFLSRSKFLPQRLAAFETLANIAKKFPGKFIKEMEEVQLPVLILDGFNKPTSVAVKSAVTRILLSLSTRFNEPFALEPYPSVPPASLFATEFSKNIHVIVRNVTFSPLLLDVLALLVPQVSDFDTKPLQNLEPCIELMHFARSYYLRHHKKFGIKQALSSLNSSDLSLAKEAALVLGLMNEQLQVEALNKVDINVAAVYLAYAPYSNEYTQLYNMVFKMPPDYFTLAVAAKAVNFVERSRFASYAQTELFNEHSVRLKHALGMKINLPTLPKSVEDTWMKRNLVTGAAEYTMLTHDFSLMPDLLPCLFSFTDPYPEKILTEVFEVPDNTERPLEAGEIFEHLKDTSTDKIPRFMAIAKHFPAKYISLVFGRKDFKHIHSHVLEVIDSYPEPLPPNSITNRETAPFYEALMYKGIRYEAFQKYAYLCISSGGALESRLGFWNTCSSVITKFTVPITRQDVLHYNEQERSVIDAILAAFRENSASNSPLVELGVLQVRNYILSNKGRLSGKVVLERAMSLRPEWTKLIMEGLDI